MIAKLVVATGCNPAPAVVEYGATRATVRTTPGTTHAGMPISGEVHFYGYPWHATGSTVRTNGVRVHPAVAEAWATPYLLAAMRQLAAATLAQARVAGEQAPF